MIGLIIIIIGLVLSYYLVKRFKQDRFVKFDIIYGKPRHPRWSTIRANHLNKYPFCEVCETSINLQVHHIKPFHIFPELELISSNLITLCEKHHLEWGHLGDWRNWNPHIWQDIRKYKKGVD